MQTYDDFFSAISTIPRSETNTHNTLEGSMPYTPNIQQMKKRKKAMFAD